MELKIYEHKAQYYETDQMESFTMQITYTGLRKRGST